MARAPKRSSDDSAIEALAALPSLGKTSAGWLVAAGIRTPQQLRRLGAVRAFKRIMMNRAGFGSTLNLLYALECAIRGCHWRDLSLDEKQQLRARALGDR